METSAATPTRPSHLPAASPSPSPSSLRLWRSAAHRNVRNQWSHIHAAKVQWLSAAFDSRSHASNLVNAHISRRGMPAMDLGVLKDMPGIRDKASSKLARREEQYRDMLVSSYKNMVRALCCLVKASRSMRCFSKVSPNDSVAQFSERRDDLIDSGDGGGAPVFKWFSILEFESFAQELVEMIVSDLKLKVHHPSLYGDACHKKFLNSVFSLLACAVCNQRLLVLELLSVIFKEGGEHQTLLDWGDELYDGESNELQSIGLQSGGTCPLPENWFADISGSRRPGNPPSYEVLQVYLTAWLANVNINNSRIDEIFELVEEEMKIKFS